MILFGLDIERGCFHPPQLLNNISFVIEIISEVVREPSRHSRALIEKVNKIRGSQTGNPIFTPICVPNAQTEGNGCAFPDLQH